MRSLAAFLPTASRFLLGLVFTVFGLAGFIHFMPDPPHPPAARVLHDAFVTSGYLFPFIKTTEIAVGLLFLSGRYIPLALVVLAPVLLNIVAFHIFLAPGTLLIVVPLVAAAIHLAWVQREAFAPLLRSHAPAAAPAGAAERGATASA